jgi:hypothetical protein
MLDTIRLNVNISILKVTEMPKYAHYRTGSGQVGQMAGQRLLNWHNKTIQITLKILL